MRVEAISLYALRMPRKAPFQTSRWTEDATEHILVRVDAEGVTGWGEVPCERVPWYHPETVQSCWHVLSEFLIPDTLGRQLEQPSDGQALWGYVRGNQFAKSGLDQALWDAYAKTRGQPLARVLGGSKERIAVGVSVGIQPSIAQTLQVVEGYLEQGYQRIKLKIGPGWDEVMLRAVRHHFGNIPMMADANSAYALDDAPLFERMDDLGLMMFEQPLDWDDIIDHAQLQKRLKTPICLDESIEHAADMRRALDIGACRIINVKVGRVGGLTEVLRIHRLARERGVPLWCGGMLESGVGRAINVALTALPGFTLPGDTSASDRYFWEDIVEPAWQLNRDGTLSVPSAPGIGVEVVPERLAKYTVQHAEFRA